MRPSEVENVIPIERDIPTKEDDQARPSTSDRPMETTGLDVKPLTLISGQGWPDEIELLKRIRRNDGETVQTEFHYLNGHHGTEVGKQEPTSEYVLSLETYGRIEMDTERRRWNDPESLAYESGQMKRLTLLSSHLRGLLQEIVDFYPAVDLTQAPLVFYRPYSFLFHFLPSLKDLFKRIDPDDCRYSDLRVLLLLCERHLSEPFGLIRSTLDRGRVSFFTLETLFRPGIKLLARDHLGQWQVFMCVEAKQESRDTMARMRLDDGEPKMACRIIAWHLAWNSILKRFERRLITFWVVNFDGSRAIDTLPVFPLDFFGNESGRAALIQSLVERGHRWRQLMSGQPTCWLHEGASIPVPGKAISMTRHETSRPTPHVGRVIVDNTASFDSSWLFFATPQSLGYGARFWDNRLEFLSYDDLPAEGEFVDEQALFCPSSVSCFDLVNQTELVLAISCLRSVNWNKAALDQLVLHKDKKETLGALIQNYAKRTVKDLTNIIPGKGAGLVIILHGPPGVGKTLTAESVAEFHQMPLISVRITDLVEGGNRWSMPGSEANVWAIIDKADKLGAILLLDEADVILEARSFEDVRRNSVVSRFLRTVEYFNGILFMTTNRLGTMDIAFQSRVQMAIEYKSLSTTTRRKIWTNIINRVEDDESREELLDELDDLRGLDLNGREILNVMKVAQSMALGSSNSSDGRKMGTTGQRTARLNISHIKRAAHEALTFQTYFKDKKEFSRSQLRVNIQGQRKTPREIDESDDE